MNVLGHRRGLVTVATARASGRPTPPRCARWRPSLTRLRHPRALPVRRSREHCALKKKTFASPRPRTHPPARPWPPQRELPPAHPRQWAAQRRALPFTASRQQTTSAIARLRPSLDPSSSIGMPVRAAAPQNPQRWALSALSDGDRRMRVPVERHRSRISARIDIGDDMK